MPQSSTPPVQGILIGLVFLLGLFSVSLSAATELRQDPRLQATWRALESQGRALIGAEGHRQLVDAAFASVAATRCPGVVFLPDQVDQHFSKLVDRSGPKEPVARQRFTVQLSTLYGTYLGLLLSESTLDAAGFCKAVQHHRQRHGGPSLFWRASPLESPHPDRLTPPARPRPDQRDTAAAPVPPG